MNIFTCPVCGEKLGLDNAPLLHFELNTAKCPKNHCFDISAKGYLNLLLPRHMNVSSPGDSKEMVAARRDFLNSGAYSPLLNALCEEINSVCSDFSSPVIADCGCGESYYTAGIYDYLAQNGKSPCVFGVDISKNALAAARVRTKGRDISMAVGSVFRLPILTGSVDLATVIFAPFMAKELHRILKKDGYVITAIPAARHLHGLRTVLYDEPRLNEVKPYEIDSFEFIGKREVSYTLSIDNQEQLNALFTMTPYFYKTSPKDSNKLYGYFGQHDVFSTEIEFEILKYKVRK
ncbi:MAG: methyltransferase domain-containing protein [Oscillospiraceae bacterium]